MPESTHAMMEILSITMDAVASVSMRVAGSALMLLVGKISAKMLGRYAYVQVLLKQTTR